VSGRPRSIALVDWLDGGHHRGYLEVYSQALAEEGFEVHVISRSQVNVPESLSSNIHLVLAPGNPAKHWSFLQSVRLLNKLSSVIRKIGGVDLVVFMDTAPINAVHGRAIDIVFPFSWAALNMQPILLSTKISLSQRLKRRLRGRQSGEGYIYSGKMKFLAFLSEDAPKRYQKIHPHKRFIWLPDVALDHSKPPVDGIAEKLVKKANGRAIVTLAGSLEYRKGVTLLMHVALVADPSRYCFAFCGEPSWHSFPDGGRIFAEFASQPRDNCFFYLEPISEDRQFDNLLRSSDVIFNAMIDFDFSSNIASKAGLMEKPIIVTAKGDQGLRAMKYRLGPAIPENDVYCALKALDDVTSGSWQGEWAQFKHKFCYFSFKERLAEILQVY